MYEINAEQIRQFRLKSHHLDKYYTKKDLKEVVGACGLQNSPPDTWQSSLFQRIPEISKQNAGEILENQKTLLQAWSFRGAPIVFPTAESRIFLPTLIPEEEPWIYTRGLQNALDLLDMTFAEVWQIIQQVISELDNETISSKITLDQQLADWMLPLLPTDKIALWKQPSIYGNPSKQTIGGAVASFLLRPCAFQGQIVFGSRQGQTPTFTSYRNWLGTSLNIEQPPIEQLVKKFIHCYGPTTPHALASWLGCSPQQARRMWQTIAQELTEVTVETHSCSILTEDLSCLLKAEKSQRQLHLLRGHDPYLDLRDRKIILNDKKQQKIIWQTVFNPGAILFEGKICGFWKTKSQGKKMSATATLWENQKISAKKIEAEIEKFAAFQQQILTECLIHVE